MWKTNIALALAFACLAWGVAATAQMRTSSDEQNTATQEQMQQSQSQEDQTVRSQQQGSQTNKQPQTQDQTSMMTGQQQTARSSMDASRMLHLGASKIRTIQMHLAQMGFNPGPIDGIWGVNTRRALMNYQQANRLEPTGTITIETIGALGGSRMLAQMDRFACRQTDGASSVPLHASPTMIREVQATLMNRGIYSGQVTGRWDNQTREAAREFQQMAGLEPSGRLTFATISALGLQPMVAQMLQSGSMQGSPMMRDQGMERDDSMMQDRSMMRDGSMMQDRSMMRRDRMDQVTVGQARNEGTPIYISSNEVADVQFALNRMGFYAGPPDGRWGPRTASAVLEYQRSSGLEPTGTLTVDTIQSLGLGQSFAGIVPSGREMFAGGMDGRTMRRDGMNGRGYSQPGYSPYSMQNAPDWQQRSWGPSDPMQQQQHWGYSGQMQPQQHWGYSGQMQPQQQWGYSGQMQPQHWGYSGSRPYSQHPQYPQQSWGSSGQRPYYGSDSPNPYWQYPEMQPGSRPSTGWGSYDTWSSSRYPQSSSPYWQNRGPQEQCPREDRLQRESRYYEDERGYYDDSDTRGSSRSGSSGSYYE